MWVMLDTAEALRLMLAALALGVVLPVMVQLFLILRQARKTLSLLSKQVEPSLRLFNEMSQRQRRDPQPDGSQLASIVATLIPAAMAAYRTFRQHQAAERAESGSLVKTNDDDEQDSCESEVEKDHARTKQS
jgi:hypothetical protein